MGHFLNVVPGPFSSVSYTLVVFVSGASQRLGSRISKFFRQNTTPERAWRFFRQKFEFLIPSLPLPQATKMTPDAVLDGGMETEAYA